MSKPKNQDARSPWLPPAPPSHTIFVVNVPAAVAYRGTNERGAAAVGSAMSPRPRARCSSIRFSGG